MRIFEEALAERGMGKEEERQTQESMAVEARL
jgi:hypothetical protein